MTEQNQDGTQRIFISEVQRHQARYRKLIQFTHSSTKAAGAMLLAAVVALIVANTGAYEAFLEFWHTEAGFFFGDAFAGMSLAHVINDIFMAVFFLLVGLEVKYELTVGELTNMLGDGRILVQRLGDIFDGKRTWEKELVRSNVAPTLDDAVAGDITAAMPYRAMTNILNFMLAVDEVVPGFAAQETLLYSPELKFYSNRVKMDERFLTSVCDLMCLGDSSGWTRGLMMASVMGWLAGRVVAEEL